MQLLAGLPARVQDRPLLCTSAAPQGKFNPLPAPKYNGNKTLLTCQWRELAFALPSGGQEEALEMEFNLGQGVGAGEGRGGKMQPWRVGALAGAGTIPWAVGCTRLTLGDASAPRFTAAQSSRKRL